MKTGAKTVTETFECEQGLLQGDNFSCLAFVVYLNDLGDYLIQNGSEPIIIAELYICILLFADDLCMCPIS